MLQFRRKSKINEKVRIGAATPLQQYIFRLPRLQNWVTPIAVISEVKTYSFGGKTHRASNSDVHRALEQLVHLGVLEKKK